MILVKRLSLVRASGPSLNSVISSWHCGHRNCHNKTKIVSIHSLFYSSDATTRVVTRHKTEFNNQFTIHQRAQGSSHVHLSIAHKTASSKSTIKTTRLFVRDQRARLPSRAAVIHSRISRKLIKHAFTPQHQNIKCLVRATRARGSRQHNRQIVRFGDAISVALRLQTVGSDKLAPLCPKKTTSSASTQQSTKTPTKDAARLLWP